MWINNSIAKPLRKGNYKTLVESDGLGNLKEFDGEHFNGTDWSWTGSNAQFISYWFANEEDYETITNHLEKLQEDYMKEMEEHSKNYGGL